MKPNKLLALVTIGATALTWADVSVVDVKCTPRSPWNGLVDVSYTVACDDPNAEVYVNPVGYDGDRGITLFPSSFTGDGATNTVKAGKHQMVWNALKDFGAFSCANFQMKMYAGKRLPRYVVIDLSSGSESTDYPVRFSFEGPDVTQDACRTTELWLRLVCPGSFYMGSPTYELGREDNEDLHRVTFTQPFYMGVFEVTQKQWELVCGDRQSYFKEAENSDVRPVENTNLGYIRGSSYPLKSDGLFDFSFMAKIRGRAHLVGIDLPSEARWEYACRAGTMTALHNGKNLTDVQNSGTLVDIVGYYDNRYGNHSYSSSSVSVGTAKVGSFKPNALGLYDMLGNVSELCRDGYSSNEHLGFDEVCDPGVADAVRKDNLWFFWVRGGDWCSQAAKCRSARRWVNDCVYYGREKNPSSFYWNDHRWNTVGFRICCEVGF